LCGIFNEFGCALTRHAFLVFQDTIEKLRACVRLKKKNQPRALSVKCYRLQYRSKHATFNAYSFIANRLVHSTCHNRDEKESRELINSRFRKLINGKLIRDSSFESHLLLDTFGGGYF